LMILMTRHASQYDRGPTLCAPDAEKSCFACCPPIRPAGYEHIRYRTIIQRMLRENTRSFDCQNRDLHPITGFSCWALGYLDNGSRLVGCLLHPARHNGRDLRPLVDYGEKCRRESCPESRTFLAMSPESRRYWLRLAKGLNSFQYSSRRFNPLFRLLGWGQILLGRVASEQRETDLTRNSLSALYPVLASDLGPRANAYLLGRIIMNVPLEHLRAEMFSRRFGDFSGGIVSWLREMPLENQAPYTHLLALDSLFLDLLRLGGGIRRIREDQAQAFKKRVDRAVTDFLHEIRTECTGGPKTERSEVRDESRRSADGFFKTLNDHDGRK
jgi:hypothetical protein